MMINCIIKVRQLIASNIVKNYFIFVFKLFAIGTLFILWESGSIGASPFYTFQLSVTFWIVPLLYNSSEPILTLNGNTFSFKLSINDFNTIPWFDDKTKLESAVVKLSAILDLSILSSIIGGNSS